MRALSMLLAAFAVATALFWTIIVTDPPRSEAAVAPLRPLEMMRTINCPPAEASDAI